jgi:hypothetical protein
MYQYVKSFLKPVGVNQSYQDINVSLMTLGDIYKKFIDGYIELSNTAIDGNVFLSVEDLKSCDLPKRDNLTFEYWLSYIGNRSLPTTDTRVEFATKKISHRDALQAGYDLMICSRDAHYDANLPQSEKKDLYLTKSTGAIGLLRTRSLVSVNGHLHPHRSYYRGICVLGGGESTPATGNFLCSITSFATIGDVSFVPFSPPMIHRYAPATPYSQQAIIDTAVDLSDKTVMLSLGGVLVTSSKVIEVVNPENGIIKLNLSRFDIVDAIYQSVGKINLESLGILDENSLANNYRFPRAMLLSDEVVLKYLQLVQTFLIVIDNPNVQITKEPVSRTGIAGKFEVKYNPTLPLVDDTGRIVEYWVDSQNDGWYILHTNSRWYKKRIIETKPVDAIVALNQSMAVNDYYETAPQFLNIVAQEPITT